MKGFERVWASLQGLVSFTRRSKRNRNETKIKTGFVFDTGPRHERIWKGFGRVWKGQFPSQGDPGATELKRLAHARVHIQVLTRIPKHVHMPTHIDTYVDIHTCTHKHKHVHDFANTYTHTRTHTHRHIMRIHIDTHTHTRKHIHRRRCTNMSM